MRIFIILILNMLIVAGKAQPGNESMNTNNIGFQFIENEHWKSFVEKFNCIGASNQEKLNILHIGDSHIQGGYFSNTLRELFTGINIKAGRGMTFPYSLSKTNGPEDIIFRSNTKWTSIKCNKNAISKTGIAGYELESFNSSIDFFIKLNCINSHKIRIYHNAVNFNTICSAKTEIRKDRMNDSIWFTEYSFNCDIDSIHFEIIRTSKNPKYFKLYLFSFENSSDDFVYNSLGINGITFNQYQRGVDYLPWIKYINPDCIIVSLGTNDVFTGNVDPMKFKRTVVSMVDNIYKELPNSIIILTSPGDHLKHLKTPNSAVVEARNIIREVALEKGCVFWDFFEVMGGLGSSKEWNEKGWMFKDLVHLSKEGYKQQARLFFNSFMYSVDHSKVAER